MDYTPELVDRWLRQWEFLRSLAESPSTSAHLLSSECRGSDKACSNGRPVGIKNIRNHSDPMHYADLLADLQTAAEMLPPYSLESQVVARRIATGKPMAEIRAQLGKGQTEVWSAYRSACKLMAKALGWVDEQQAKDARTDGHTEGDGRLALR